MRQAPDDFSAVTVRLAQGELDLHAAQAVRYQVFYDEYGAQPSAEMEAVKRDFDHYDAFADHLIVTDSSSGQERVVGTYRLMREESAKQAGGFYSADEFDLSPLLSSDLSLLELGRSCVLPEYRARTVLNKLWQGIADYITEHKIDMMFGCASLHGTDVDELAEQLAYMKHFHTQESDLCPKAVSARYVDMNLMGRDDFNAKRAFASLPPIIKGISVWGARLVMALLWMSSLTPQMF